MVKLKRIGVLSFAKFLTALMAFVGLLAGILYSGIGFIYDAFTGALGAGTALAFLALIGMPIIFAASGLAVGVIGGLLYNLIAGWVGGIEIDFDHKP